MSDGSVTNPGTIRTFTHKAQMRRRQKDPRFKKMKQEHALIPGAFCVHCLRKHGEPRINMRTGDSMLTTKKGKVVVQLTSLTINHKTENSNLTDENYLGEWDDDKEVCCVVCNGYYRQGKKACPVCKIVPINANDTGMCNACYLAAHPDIKEQTEADKETRIEGKRQYNKKQALKRRTQKNKSRCKFFRAGQKCGFRLGSKCPHAPTKAEQNCVDYQWRLFAKAHKKEEK